MSPENHNFVGFNKIPTGWIMFSQRYLPTVCTRWLIIRLESHACTPPGVFSCARRFTLFLFSIVAVATSDVPLSLPPLLENPPALLVFSFAFIYDRNFSVRCSPCPSFYRGFKGKFQIHVDQDLNIPESNNFISLGFKLDPGFWLWWDKKF